jgi:hypothetical protein
MTDMTDMMADEEYTEPKTVYIVELERDDVTSLVHAAHMHAERLSAPESKRLVDSANRLSSQVLHINYGL